MSTSGSHAPRLALMVALLSVWPATALAQSYNVHHYTNRDGLPQRQVLSLHQGHDGYVWFGTYGGLSRFNGSSIRTYTTEDGLSSNVVEAIAEDSRGRLVLGTQGGGICYMELESFRCLAEAEGLASSDVRDLVVEDDSTLWVATAGGVSRLDGDRFTTLTAEGGLPGPAVLALERDRSGVLWAGTGAGLARWNGSRFVEAFSPELGERPVQMLLTTRDGLLVGTDRALHLVSGDAVTTLDIPQLPGGASCNAAAPTVDGEVWLGTDRGLLHRRDDGFHLLTMANGLLQNTIMEMMVDREGNVWMGTEMGADKLVPGPFTAYGRGEGIPNPFVRAVAEDDEGRLWVGTRSGVAVQEGERFRVVVPGEDLPDERVYSLASAPGGGMLVGTRQGLVHWRSDRAARHYREGNALPGGFVLALLGDDDGGVWVGTDRGLARWAGGELTPLPSDHPLAGLFVVSLAHGPRGRLWVGLRSGGVRIWDGERVTVLDLERGLTDQTIWSMDVDRQNRMWLASNGDGAFLVEEGEIRSLTTEQGLVNDFVWQVLADSRGSIWLYTNRGLDRYRDGDFLHYGVGDGLVDLEGSANASLEDSDGDLWFGSGTGLLHFASGEEQRNYVPPPIRIESATESDRPLEREGSVGPGGGMVRLSFAALSFRNEGSVRYRYRLLRGPGGQAAWSEPLRDRAVTFASLAPGHYTFEVVGINDDGLASESPATFSFTVRPAFWQTWWFWLGSAGLLVAGAAGIPVLRAHRLREERIRLEGLVAERTREIENANDRLRDEIRERERFEEALQASETRLREIVENSTNVFYSHTPDHRITYMSPQVEDLLGLTPEEARVRWTEFLSDHPGNEAGIRATARAIETGERQDPYELELETDEGERIWVRVTEAPVVRDGETVAMVGSLTDVTETRRAQAERALLEEQLHQSQKMEAVGRLAGGVAHDFNNLLTSILGHAELVAADLGPDHPSVPELQEVHKACDRASSLVEQLLAFGRKQTVRPRELDLNEAVDERIGMLGRVLGEAVDLRTDLAPFAPRTVMDRGQIDQILLNLCVNGRDAMPRGGVLTISTAREILDAPPQMDETDFSPGEHAVLRVTDTGCGMDPDVAERIFEPFFTTKTRDKGTGLGLSTVYGIVKQNSGCIRVRTAPSKGTTISVYLPTVAAEDLPGNVA